MQKLRKAAVVLLILSLCVTGVYFGYEYVTRDTEPPVVTCPQARAEVSVGVTEEELLAGVTAQDNRSGDVSNTLVLEKMTSIAEDNTREAIFAAIDDAGNVGRGSMTVSYTDYEPPRFRFDAPLRISDRNLLETQLAGVTVSSVLDGDLTPVMKSDLTAEGIFSEPGLYSLELKVQDSAGTGVIIPTVVEIYNPALERLHVELSQYIVYLHVNDSFEPRRYYRSSGSYGDLTVDSDVDVRTPGVYHVEYTVRTDDDRMGKSRLVVVVEE